MRGRVLMRTSRDISAASRRLSEVAQSRWVLRHRSVVAYVADLVAWSIALTFAALVRYNLSASSVEWRGIAIAIAMVAGLQLVFGLLFGLYLGRWSTGTIDEVIALGASTATVTVALFCMDTIFPRPVPL